MHNDHVIYDGRKLAAFNIASDFCKEQGYTTQFLTELWDGLLSDPVLYDEFVYFLQTGELTGNTRCGEYSMYDLYFYELGVYNLTHDQGKNEADCDKTALLFQAFHMMGRIKKEPETYLPRLSDSLGMDFF